MGSSPSNPLPVEVVLAVAADRPEALWDRSGRDRLEALDRVWLTAEPGGRVARSTLHAVRIAFGSHLEALSWAEGAFRAIAELGWGRLRGGMVAGRPEVRTDPLTGRTDLLGAPVLAASRLADLASPGELLVDDGIGFEIPRSHRPEETPGGWSLRWPPSSARERTPLPEFTSPFLGRLVEREALEQRLRLGRVVQLIGPGGAGKTRLAVEVAAAWIRSGGEAIFAALESTRCDIDVLLAIGAALRLDLSDPDRSAAVGRIGRALAHRGELLLVLDNAEQVAAEVTALAGALIGMAPGLHLLITSRVRLEGLDPVHLGGLGRDEAVALLRTRPTGVLPWSADDERDAEALAARLDHLPLALELAASHLDLLRPSQVLERMDAPGSGQPDRQASLRSTVEWSVSWLAPEVRQALVELAVFRAPFGPPAAEAVLALPSASGWQALRALVDANLVRRVDDRPRFALYEQVRIIAETWLAGSPEAAAVEERHARWVVREVPSWWDGDQSPTRPERSLRVREERSELLAVLDGPSLPCAAWAAMALVGGGMRSAAPLDVTLGWVDQGVRCAERTDDPLLRALLEWQRSRLLATAGRASAAADALAQARVLADRSGDRRVDGWLALTEGIFQENVGAHADAEARIRWALDQARRVGAVHLEFVALESLAMILLNRGPERTEEALETTEAAIRVAESDRGTGLTVALLLRSELRRRIGDPRAESDLGLARDRIDVDDGVAHNKLLRQEFAFALARGDMPAALARAFDCLERARGAGDRLNEAFARRALAMVWLASGDLDRCERALTEARVATPAPFARAMVDLMIAEVAIERHGTDGEGLLDRVPEWPPFAPVVAMWRGICAALRGERSTAQSWRERAGADGSLEIDLLLEVDALRGVAPGSPAAVALAERLESTPHPTDEDFHCARRVGKSAFDRWIGGPRRTLQLSADGSRVRLPSGLVLELSRRGSLRRILQFLVTQRLEAPGRAQSLGEVFAAGWPSERAHPRSANSRVYVAMSSLRKLGVDALVTRDDGYLLDPRLRIATDAEGT